MSAFHPFLPLAQASAFDPLRTLAAHIWVKVLGLAWRGDQLLLSEVKSDSGEVRGFRALGGSVEFGETRELALQREFKEELGCPITIIPPWHSLENLFVHEGALGHEYVFVTNIQLEDERIYAMENVLYLEASLSECHAAWHTPTASEGDLQLYPCGLLAMIESGNLSKS